MKRGRQVGWGWRCALAVSWCTVLWCLALAGAAVAGSEEAVSAVSARPRLAVVGVANESEEEDFNSLLIVEGISNILAQEFYDSGRYLPVEEKPEIVSRIRELLASGVGAGPAAERLSGTDGGAVAGELGCGALVFATVKGVEKSRSRSMVGPFSSATVKVTVTVEVALREGGGAVVRSLGQGSGVTKSKGVFFQVREGKVHFDQTSVGRAVQDALHEAVGRLMQERAKGSNS